MNFELKDHTINNFIPIVKIEKGIPKDSTLIKFFYMHVYTISVFL